MRMHSHGPINMKKIYFSLILLFSVVVGQPANSERSTFMTGPAGGTWYPLGGAVKQLLEDEIENLDDLLAQK